MTKNDNFGANLVVFGHKILIYTGESKSFGTHITEKPLCLLYILVRHGMKWAKNTNIWPKMTNNAFLGQIWPFFLLILVQTPNFVFVKKIGGRVKKSSPTPLLGHCLPVTALALRKTHLVFSDKGLHGFMKGGAVYLWFLSRDRMGQLIAIDRQGRQDRNN